jgi:lysophospholipase L1-like esterase
MGPREPGCRLGVLAFGDSITNGGGELQWGVALQSWALWTARGLGLPYSPQAVDGAITRDVVETQIPRYLATAAQGPGARYELGCLYVGTNDVRRGWDPAAFGPLFDTALEFVAGRCDRAIVATIPLTMGRPAVPALIEEANVAIEAAAARHRALVLDLRDFRGRTVMMADHVHPTAFGQIAIAERALDLLAAAGMEVRLRPSALIAYSTTRRGRARGEATYAWRAAKERWRAARAQRRA